MRFLRACGVFFKCATRGPATRQCHILGHGDVAVHHGALGGLLLLLARQGDCRDEHPVDPRKLNMEPEDHDFSMECPFPIFRSHVGFRGMHNHHSSTRQVSFSEDSHPSKFSSSSLIG